MKQTSVAKFTLLTIACIGLALAPAVHAGHATNFLDQLEAAVDARLEALPDDASAEERRALTQGAAALDRNTRTLWADLLALAKAAVALNGTFGGDIEIFGAQLGALAKYSAEANAQREAVGFIVGASEPPQSLANQLAQIDEALAAGNNEENDVPTRAQALALALRKLRSAAVLANRVYRAPISLEGKVVTLTGRESDRDAVTIELYSNGTYTIPEHGDEAEESGVWSYERTGANTGTVTLSSGGTLDLKFSNSSKGSFRGTGADEETVRGGFRVSEPPAEEPAE
jgi:hypothetical protein